MGCFILGQFAQNIFKKCLNYGVWTQIERLGTSIFPQYKFSK